MCVCPWIVLDVHHSSANKSALQVVYVADACITLRTLMTCVPNGRCVLPCHKCVYIHPIYCTIMYVPDSLTVYPKKKSMVVWVAHVNVSLEVSVLPGGAFVCVCAAGVYCVLMVSCDSVWPPALSAYPPPCWSCVYGEGETTKVRGSTLGLIIGTERHTSCQKWDRGLP